MWKRLGLRLLIGLLALGLLVGVAGCGPQQRGGEPQQEEEKKEDKEKEEGEDKEDKEKEEKEEKKEE